MENIDKEKVLGRQNERKSIESFKKKPIEQLERVKSEEVLRWNEGKKVRMLKKIINNSRLRQKMIMDENNDENMIREAL